MSSFQKFSIVVVLILFAVYINLAFFRNHSDSDIDDKLVKGVNTEEIENAEKQKEPEEKLPKEYINVFFIAHNEKGEEVYRAVKREYLATDENSPSRLKVAIKSLIEGPTLKEKKMGVYTEVPNGTRLISITESPSKVVINLSSEFENGGGTDGLYKRLFQLIKTSKRNSNLPIYLQINGQQVDVIGGEGIMITQPLSEDFAND